MTMRLDIVSLFPGICAGSLNESIMGRAQKQGFVKINLIDLRDFTYDVRRTVDDSPYGGGAGMVLQPEPLFQCLSTLVTKNTRVILMTPQGQPFKQKVAARLAKEEHLVILCGHYEGVDERIRQCLVHEEISLGDYVLTNGAIAAVVVADAVIRLIPGVLGSPESPEEESFGQSRPLLEYPQYTRPENFRGMKVPPVLLGGNHEEIASWREEQRLIRTISRRPDLLHKQFEHSEIGEKDEHN